MKSSHFLASKADSGSSPASLNMLIDTHAHLNFAAFDKDRGEVIRRALDAGAWILNVGSNYQTSKKAVEIAERYNKGVYAAIGLHPINLDTGLVKIRPDKQESASEQYECHFNTSKYRSMAKSDKVVAIGEIGLDYWYKPKTKKKLALFKQKQKEVFLKQLELAKELNLPIIFHCRKAHDDLINELRIMNYELGIKGVVHCFTGSWQQAKEYLEMGLYLGFNGIIYKLDLDEIIKKTPLERILIETDCPFLAPPEARTRRNEPLYVKYIAQKIAELKNIIYEEVANITTASAKKLFSLK